MYSCRQNHPESQAEPRTPGLCNNTPLLTLGHSRPLNRVFLTTFLTATNTPSLTPDLASVHLPMPASLSVSALVLGGTGGIGSVIASHLHHSPHNVSILSRSPATNLVHIEATLPGASSSNMLSSIPALPSTNASFSTWLSSSTSSRKVLFVTTKAYDVIPSLSSLLFSASLSPTSSSPPTPVSVVILSNGLLSLTDELVPLLASPLISSITLASTSIGATVLSCDQDAESRSLEVKQNGWGDTVLSLPLGSPVGVDLSSPPSPTFLLPLLNSLQFPTTHADSIWTLLWLKLCANCIINPICALNDKSNRHTYELLESEQLLPLLLDELVAVGNRDLEFRGSSDRLTADLVDDTVRRVVKLTEDNDNSLLQDVRHSRRTEIEMLNGFVAARGREFSIATPANSLLAERVLNLNS